MPDFSASAAEPTEAAEAIETAVAAKGQKTLSDPALQVTHTEYYEAAEGDAIHGKTVLQFINQIWGRLKYPNGSNFLEQGGPFKGYKIATWHKNRVAEGNIAGHAGLTGPLDTRINGNYLSDSGYGTSGASGVFGGIYSHEFGHNYHFMCDMRWDGKIHFVTTNPISQLLIDTFRRLRGSDARPPKTNEVERFTEDFKYFFGTDNIAGLRNKNDDAQTVAGVRWADMVTGLGPFIRGMWPVFRWLNGHQVRNFSYNEKDGTFTWERHLGGGHYRWERFFNGVIFRWDTVSWQVANKKTTVILPGNHEKWKATGIRVVKGEPITITASGRISFFLGGNWPFTPAGEAGRRAGNGAPAPGEIANSLVAHTGGRPIYIGNSRKIIADSTTELFVAANDDFFPDNGGQWNIDIEV